MRAALDQTPVITREVSFKIAKHEGCLSEVDFFLRTDWLKMSNDTRMTSFEHWYNTGTLWVFLVLAFF
jgi:hypothetical protein